MEDIKLADLNLSQEESIHLYRTKVNLRNLKNM